MDSSDVSIVEILPSILEESDDNNLKLSLLNLINERDISIYTCTRPNKVIEEGLEVILPSGKEGGVEADIIAIVINQKPEVS